MTLIAQPINCTLKHKRGETSSTDAMIDVLGEHFSKAGVKIEKTIRISAYNVMPGVSSDEGKGDDWPGIRQKILAADILIFGTPIWMGQPSSVAKRVLERMDAFLSETDEKGRMPSYGKVAVAAIVGNEDGAHPWSAARHDVGVLQRDLSHRSAYVPFLASPHASERRRTRGGERMRSRNMTVTDKLVCQAAALLVLFALTLTPAKAQFGGGGGGQDMMTQMAPMLEMMKKKMGKKRFGALMQTMGPMMSRMTENGGGGLGGLGGLMGGGGIPGFGGGGGGYVPEGYGVTSGGFNTGGFNIGGIGRY